ncbi:MAG: 1-(5-phosphoribosyl)-5-amino-4-imidazole-carboxylate carboxylase, partial [Candidatus Schekmanbacteria bacterium RBG_13_48_7]
MKTSNIKDLLQKLYDRKVTPGEALDSLKFLPFQDMGFAMVDSHRELRKGFPEVVYAKGKTTEEVLEITKTLASKFPNVLITRANADIYRVVHETIPESEFYSRSGVISIHREKMDLGTGNILVVSAGTSDIPVAEEAYVTASIMGNRVTSTHDVGIAGIHRLLAIKDQLLSARVIIVVAGMEGALPSVIAGLVDKPVIGVPTSVGYGTSFGGIAALLAMLNACASGVAVVNIDNGFGAGYL